MEECVKLGLAKSIGISNFNTQQINRVLEVATIPPAVNQVILSLALPLVRLLTVKVQTLLTVKLPFIFPGCIIPAL
jgi:diketogulonate reductase-like aldo/keto reductase